MDKKMDVKIIQLEPMRVACFPAYGPEPEDEAWQRLLDWARPQGLLEDPEKNRIFGFDTTGSSPVSGNRGYEFWLEVGPQVEESAGVTIRNFAGGKYAVYRIEKIGEPWQTIPAGWQALVLWQEDSPYPMRHAVCLEQRIGQADLPLADCAMDLFLSID